MNDTRILCTPYNPHPDGYILYSHISSIFCSLINFLSVYCIIWKSSASMKSYRWHLLLYQIAASLLDIAINVLTIPVLFLPIPMGYPAGILYYTSIDVHILTCFVFLTLAFVVIVTTNLFFFRYQTALLPGHLLKLSEKQYYIVTGIAFLLLIGPVVYGTADIHPHQQENIRYYTETYTCLDNILYLPRIQIYRLSEVAVFTAAWLAASFFMIFLIMLLVFLTYYSLRNVSLSPATAKLQRKFLLYLCIQTAVPVTLITLPEIYIFGHFLDGTFVNQDLLNFSVWLISTHGATGSIVMLIVLEPYRKFILDKIGCFFPINPTTVEKNSVMATTIISGCNNIV